MRRLYPFTSALSIAVSLRLKDSADIRTLLIRIGFDESHFGSLKAIAKENITKVTFEGDERALKDIEILAGVNYGEDSMGKGIPLPKELSYLKQ